MYSRYIRDMSSDVADVKNTFPGWDQCMTKAYCKWPVIIGIVVGAVIAISIVWCLVRCLCCGMECCCGCLSCFSCCTSCCHNNHHRNQGYTQPPPPVSQFPQYTQYQPAAAPVYRSQQQQQPQYAHFDAPSKPYNEDALPPMPSWNNSRTLRQQDTDVNEMEMGSMHNQAAQPMLPKSPRAQVQEYPYQANAGAYGGDVASSQRHSPYGDEQPQQYGYGHQSPSVASRGYEASVNPPPSYHTSAPGAQGVARKPVSGSWRDL
ncbi:hypothetical protein E4T44_00028 [Aureobasidium sp. EXF-8845]|nr:hypothetical protein E4T44_00028 [Aureobasidium sp. EXF-8845]KAI4858433.1 hypothetical protein E4T45_00045 [Aureobasidium sp. EXF-8846]